jgi:ABC-type dipeptide/oligopeptide/nickel transport system permease component
MQGATFTKATIAALDEQCGVNTMAQYTHFWGDVLHGNLGTSTSNGFVAVSTVIREALPWTLGLVGVATVISFALGTPIGVLVAWRRGSWLGNLLPATTSDNGYALLQGLFLIITLAVLAANLLADFVYVFLDPRTRQEA